MKKIITYILITFLLSIVGYYLVIHSKALGISPFLGMLYLMWCPAGSAVLTCLVYDGNLSCIGWKPGCWRWLALGYCLPIGYASLAYCFIWITGLGMINAGYQIHVFRLIVIGTLLNIVFALGEEIGWRGFLVPQLYKYKSFTTACFVTGIVWAVWHFPLIISGAYLVKMPVYWQLLFFVISVIAMAFPLGWLRLKSGSVWPAVLFHASHNLYIQRLFDPLTLETNALSKYAIGESGFVLVVFYAAIAFIFWNSRGSFSRR